MNDLSACNRDKYKSKRCYEAYIKKISGIRFQKIVNLRYKSVVAKEVLTNTREDPELFFSMLPPEVNLSIFLWQVEVLNSFPGIHWLNLPVSVFCDPYLIEQLLNSGPADKSIAIELQDPENIAGLDHRKYQQLKDGVSRVMCHGWHLILDDLSSSVDLTISARDFQFPIVKLDRDEIRHNPDIKSLVQSARRLGSFIVMEGIETPEDYKIAKESGADAGQGFFWTQDILDCMVPEIVARRAWKWHMELRV